MLTKTRENRNPLKGHYAKHNLTPIFLSPPSGSGHQHYSPRYTPAHALPRLPRPRARSMHGELVSQRRPLRQNRWRQQVRLFVSFCAFVCVCNFVFLSLLLLFFMSCCAVVIFFCFILTHFSFSVYFNFFSVFCLCLCLLIAFSSQLLLLFISWLFLLYFILWIDFFPSFSLHFYSRLTWSI